MNPKIYQKQDGIWKQLSWIIISLGLFLSITLFSIEVNASVTYVSYYDKDNITATNPQEDDLVPSYLLDENHIFMAAIAVETQNITQGTEANLTLRNSTNNYTFRTTVDSYGYASFVISLPYSADGYQYRIDVDSTSTNTKSMKRCKDERQ